MLFSGYQIKSDHRDKTHMKSQWEVNEIEELKVFTFGFCNNWIDEKDDVLWSCSEDFQSIGFESKKNRLRGSKCKELFFARFTKDKQHVWHGFPISKYNNEDRIPKSVIEKMQKYFSSNPPCKNKFCKSSFSKFMQGKL